MHNILYHMVFFSASIFLSNYHSIVNVFKLSKIVNIFFEVSKKDKNNLNFLIRQKCYFKFKEKKKKKKDVPVNGRAPAHVKGGSQVMILLLFLEVELRNIWHWISQSLP
jgi:hypothetical protein